jgi:hypothetical protein
MKIQLLGYEAIINLNQAAISIRKDPVIYS